MMLLQMSYTGYSLSSAHALRPTGPPDPKTRQLRLSSAAAPQGGEGPAVWLPHGAGGRGGNWVKEERSSVWTTFLQP